MINTEPDDKSSPGFRIWIRSDSMFLPGAGSNFKISLHPDSVFKFLRIRIWFSPGAKKMQCRWKIFHSEVSGSGLEMLGPDPVNIRTDPKP